MVKKSLFFLLLLMLPYGSLVSAYTLSPADKGILDSISSFIQKKYAQRYPLHWGEFPTKTINRFATNKQELALTLDACGGKNGNRADMELLDFLIEHKIKATLFINVRWIANNEELLNKLIKSNLFDIENHGLYHSPLSVNGNSVYNINGTGSPFEVVYEVEGAGLIIKNFTGKKPQLFRSGTAYYDEVALDILDELGYIPVAYSINADRGATLPSDEVYAKMIEAASGDIIIAHMNRPGQGTAQGLIKAIKELRLKGYEFVRLSDIDNQKLINEPISIIK